MRGFLPVLLIAATAVPLSAQEISVLSSRSVQGPLLELAREYRQQTGHEVKIQFESSANITSRLAAGEAPDVLIALADTIQQAVADRRAFADSRTPIGKIPVGVGISGAMSHAGLRPDISSVEAFKAALIKADAVLYTRGASGAFVEKLFRDIGVAEQIKGRVVQVPTAVDLMERLGSASGNEIGLTMVSEIRYGEAHGGSLVGLLPAAVQNYTAFDAVAMSGARAPDAARAFVRLLTTPAARRMFAADGWE